MIEQNINGPDRNAAILKSQNGQKVNQRLVNENNLKQFTQLPHGHSHGSRKWKTLKFANLTGKLPFDDLFKPLGTSEFMRPQSQNEMFVGAAKHDEEPIILGNPRPKDEKEVDEFIKLADSDSDSNDHKSHKVEGSNQGSKHEVSQKFHDQDSDSNGALNVKLKVFPNSSLDSGSEPPSYQRGALVGDIFSAASSSKFDKQTDPLQSADRPINKFVSDESDPLESASNRHQLEPELSSDLSLQEEEKLMKKLTFLRRKLRQRQRLAHLKEQQKITQEALMNNIEENASVTPLDDASIQPQMKSFASSPKLEMHRLDENSFQLKPKETSNMYGGNMGSEGDSEAMMKVGDSSGVVMARNATTDIGRPRAPRINPALFAFSYDQESPLGMLVLYSPYIRSCFNPSQIRNSLLNRGFLYWLKEFLDLSFL